MTDTPEFDIDELYARLAEHRLIATVWGTDDVREIRPDLTDDQAWEVLQAARQHHDANIGITWDVLGCHADILFGPGPDDADESDDDRIQPEGE